MTVTTQLVLAAPLAEPGEEKYGLQIVAVVGLPSGTVHPIPAWLDGLGWLESRWENHDPREQGRPRRRCYRLTADGGPSRRAPPSPPHTGQQAPVPEGP
jgi:PadR family transcriptional regulator PadR